MKLIHCTACKDVLRIFPNELRTCHCGKSWGGYLQDDIRAVFGGPVIPLGMGNSTFADALRTRPKEGLGSRFEAWVMPEVVDTIEVRGESASVDDLLPAWHLYDRSRCRKNKKDFSVRIDGKWYRASKRNLFPAVLEAVEAYGWEAELHLSPHCYSASIEDPRSNGETGGSTADLATFQETFLLAFFRALNTTTRTP